MFIDRILNFTRGRMGRIVIGAAFAGIAMYVLTYLLVMVIHWVLELNGILILNDEGPLQVVAAISWFLIVITAGFALIAGTGSLNHTRSGIFFYRLSGTALAWGITGQVLSFAIVYFLAYNVPSARDVSEPSHEAALVLAGIVSFLGFILFSGTITDWIKWSVGRSTELRHGAPPGEPEWMRYFSIDVNHKVIGIQYGVLSIFVLLFGGLLAILFRLELAFPGMQLFSYDEYNSLFSAHGMLMIVAVFLAVGAMINYLAPVMIGAADMAFPRLNAFSFWIGVPAAMLLFAGLFLGWDTGWVGYPPHSTTTNATGVVLFLLGFYLNGFASIASALNLLVTTATMRAKGMSLFRMPIFVWASIATSAMQFSVTQTVGVALSMVLAQRVIGMDFFDPSTVPAGDPVLYQHLFWFYSHPAVYVWILPGLGIIGELLPVFARKPLFGYRWVALSSIGIALVGFLVWAHHMFTSGMSEALRIPFMVSTMLVGVPTGVKFFSWTATLWGGKITFPTPMLFVLGAISIFLIGGLSGPILGTIPTDLHLHDTYWVVGHFHSTLFGGYVFPFFAALYYWYPKITGRMYNERLGKLHFWLMLPAFWVMALGQMRIGLMGMRRRIADYDPALGIDFSQSLITVATLIIGWSVLIMIYNLWSSARKPELAPQNPWGSRSPEWLAPSPLPEFNYLHPIEVVGDPYEYGLEDWEYVRTIPVTGD